ncbi:MAG: hypothetical protein HFE64_03250 [Lachnospiraceae bacterium]|jgi:hypothetical protein|nr:hypothetical protein [Lachnospiraceae bacterium]
MKLVIYMKSKEKVVFQNDEWTKVSTAGIQNEQLIIVEKEQHNIALIPMCNIEYYRLYEVEHGGEG